MAAVDPRLLTDILHACQKVDPEPYLPGGNARLTDWSWEEVKAGIERLWLDGLIAFGQSPQGGDEIAIGLTSYGHRVLSRSDGQQRYLDKVDREDRDPVLQRQRETVKTNYRNPPAPVLRRWLIWLNILVFAYGLYLTHSRNNPLSDYFFGRQTPLQVVPIMVETGMAQRVDVAQGTWWRLLSTCFVHGGILHLLMNMYALFMLGRDTEHMYGHVRFLIIYLIAGVGGTCAGLWASAAVVGASGAICGLIAAVAVWLILNRRCLPPKTISRNMWNVLFVSVIITLISANPGVSGAGHLGGAVAGGLAAILMHYQRFGRYPLIQIAALLLAVGLPVGCVYGLKRATHGDPQWAKAVQVQEVNDFEETFNNVLELDTQVRGFYRQVIQPLLDQAGKRRDPQKVQLALNEIPKEEALLQRQLQALAAFDHLVTPKLVERRKAAQSRLRNWQKFFKFMTPFLKEGKTWTRRYDNHWKPLLRARE